MKVLDKTYLSSTESTCSISSDVSVCSKPNIPFSKPKRETNKNN